MRPLPAAPLLGLLLLVPAPARAQAFAEWITTCSFGLEFCASVQVSVNNFFTTVRVQNLSGAYGSSPEWAITGLSLTNLPERVLTEPNPAGITGPIIYDFSASGAWAESFLAPSPFPPTSMAWSGRSPGGQTTGFDMFAGETRRAPDDIFGGVISSCGVDASLAAAYLWVTPTCGPAGRPHPAGPQDGWFTTVLEDDWRLYPGLTEWTPAGADLVIRAVNVKNPGQAMSCSTGDGTCVHVTPEPFSLALLGTGIAGIGLAARRRRRITAD